MAKDVRVAQLPDCEIHRYNSEVEDEEAKAEYNAYFAAPFNTWANGCGPCFFRFGVDSSITEHLVLA